MLPNWHIETEMGDKMKFMVKMMQQGLELSLGP